MRRFYVAGFAIAMGCAFAPPVMAQVSMTGFLTGRSILPPPYNSTDYLTLMRGNSVHRVPATNFLTATGAQEITGKTIDCSLNTCVNFPGLAESDPIPAGTLLGNSNSGSAAPTPIELGANLSFAGGVLNATGGGSSGSSPVGGVGAIQTNAGGGTFGAIAPGDGVTTFLGSPIGNIVSTWLPNTSVAPGSYTSASITVDQKGRITAASSGSATVASVGLSVPAASIFGTTGTPVTSSGTLGLTTTGISGGLPYFSSPSQLASSGTMPANRLVVGGGIGAPPTPLGSSGTATQVLHGNASGPPTFGPVSLNADVIGNLSLSNLATIPANTVLSNPTGGSGTPVAVAIPDCPDVGGQHLNYSGGVWTCGTSSSVVLAGGAILLNDVGDLLLNDTDDILLN